MTAKRLPPTSMANHTEEVPAGHVLTAPLGIEVQTHMLEHADGRIAVTRLGKIVVFDEVDEARIREFITR